MSILSAVNARARRVLAPIARVWRHHTVDAYVISYPKCGRTWLRVLLGRAAVAHYRLNVPDLLNMESVARRDSRIPVIRFSHDDVVNAVTPADLSPDKGKYRRKRVVLLVRDPRDVVVSAFFQLTKREGAQAGTLSEFLRGPTIDIIIDFYNIWAQNRNVPRELLVVRYEDMKLRPDAELQRILQFAGITDVTRQTIDDAVNYAKFENMQKLEMEGKFSSHRLRPTDPGDPESFKTRRGVVGGYTSYCSEEEVAYLNAKVSRLDPFFGYATLSQPDATEGSRG